MRMLGVKASLATFRWDLVYLLARLTADDRAEVVALAPAVQAMRDELAAQRAAQEGAEDAMILASALVGKHDERRDSIVKILGGVARATDKGAYAVLFPKISPSATARLPIDEESAEIARILGELGKAPDDSPLRAAYLGPLTQAEADLKAADQQADGAATALALERSQTARTKLAIDKGRLEIHGKLVVLLKDKDAVEAFFRPTSRAPGEAEEGAEPTEPTQGG
jgi:hypothetical protein